MARQIILASTSPRRKEIFAKTGLEFTVQASDYEENMDLPMPPHTLAEHLSRGKAEAVAAKNPEAIVIAADTSVVYKHHLLGKPKNEAHAREMLEMLSGKEHEILTGVTMIDVKNGKSVSFHQATKVFMKKYGAETIAAYIKTGEPMDKAGAYALQERGAVLIDRIEGDFFNAMGLPLGRLSEELEKFSIKVL